MPENVEVDGKEKCLVYCVSLVSVFSRLKEESNWTLADAELYIESLIAFYQAHHQTTFRVMEAWYHRANEEVCAWLRERSSRDEKIEHPGWHFGL